MFTGIITQIGTIEQITELDQGRRFRVASGYDYEGVEIGASIAHSGVCLTVTKKGKNRHEVEIWEEALRLSTLGQLQEGDKVNLERSLKIGDELGGHLVSGHVDAMAKIVDVAQEGAASRFFFEAPHELARFIAPKGSVALDGTSLTVNGVDENIFDVLLIAHTLEVTLWGERKKNDRINLEIDQMARYAARLREFDGG